MIRLTFMACRLIVSMLIFTVCSSCVRTQHPNVIVDVRSIVNKSPEEVVETLGDPDSVYVLQMMGTSTFCQVYKELSVEIQYPGSRATDIIVYNSHALPFDQTALAAFNLDYRSKHPSDYRRGSFIRWHDFEEFSAISFFNPRFDSLTNATAFHIFFKAKDMR